MGKISPEVLHVKQDDTVWEVSLYDDPGDVGDVYWELGLTGEPVYAAATDSKDSAAYKKYGTPLAVRGSAGTRYILTQCYDYVILGIPAAGGQYEFGELLEEAGIDLGFITGYQSDADWVTPYYDDGELDYIVVETNTGVARSATFTLTGKVGGYSGTTETIEVVLTQAGMMDYGGVAMEQGDDEVSGGGLVGGGDGTIVSPVG